MLGKLRSLKLFALKTPVGVLVTATVVIAMVGASTASASSAWWQLSANAVPTNLPPEGEGKIIVAATNLGDGAVNSNISPISVTDKLPPGVTATEIRGSAGFLLSFSVFGTANCSLAVLSCTFEETIVDPFERLWIEITVKVGPGAHSGVLNEERVVGGGAPVAENSQPLTVDASPAHFGVEGYELSPENEGGSPDTQAGSHPFQLTTTLAFNESAQSPFQPALAKDLYFDLPAGLVGNPTPFPQCSSAQFSAIKPTGANSEPSEAGNDCPAETAVGVAQVVIDEPTNLGVVNLTVPLFNLTPAVGEPARFGFVVQAVPVMLDTSVRTGSDYGVVVSVKNISEIAALLASRVTFWGVPGDPRHDNSRGWACAARNLREFAFGNCTDPKMGLDAPLLTLPTSCTGPRVTSLQGDSWADPGNLFAPIRPPSTESLDGCNRLGLNPEIKVAPDGEAGSSPSGLTVDVHVPQDESVVPTGLSESNVKDTTVVLPEGVGLNAAAADGLLSCSTSEIALESVLFPLCPDGSKVGTVRIKTPLLPNTLEGAAYLAAQGANPFKSLVALYVVAHDPVSGVLVKLAGEVKADPVTGQLVSTFKDTPQLPFEDFELHFFGGDRAPLSTPAYCGSYTTTASIAPWSGNEPATPSSTFDIKSGPNGSPCESPLPFSPSLAAGTTSIQAGGFSPFTMTIGREDGQQNIKQLTLHMPPGLSGLLSGVELCGEAQADAGSCGPNSLIGETTVSVGLGGDPFSVKGGKVYITGPYEGAPFGISVVVAAKAGPYDLGQVVVRGRIEVDPVTSALTVSTDSTGPFAIPHILDGIPLEIKHVNFTTTRSGFTFNPTNCDPMNVTGNVSSVEGASSQVSVPFQVTNCAVLGFKPAFSVSTSGRTSRANGASLHVKLAYPKAAFGSQANIKSVKVDLPKQLPSRLTTLQKACPDSTFNQNPALCSAQSRIGTATATTPLIPVALTGPAFFVSHGGAKFPELIIVLSGYGVTVDLHSETFINKAGITSSTFHTVPDVPVGTFELTLPQGKYSALAANGNLCKSTLRMPTAFTAQNGMVIHQTTPITVTGCAKKSKKASRHKRAGVKRK
jgi:hypothetical protein